MMKIQNRSRICLCISVAIMVIALVMSLLGYGINYGIDFAGGLNIQYNMGAAFEQADIEAALKNQGIQEYAISISMAAARREPVFSTHRKRRQGPSPKNLIPLSSVI